LSGRQRPLVEQATHARTSHSCYQGCLSHESQDVPAKVGSHDRRDLICADNHSVLAPYLMRKTKPNLGCRMQVRPRRYPRPQSLETRARGESSSSPARDSQNYERERCQDAHSTSETSWLWAGKYISARQARTMSKDERSGAETDEQLKYTR
jgi:hypothetical protein